jgi:hypothetical protein
VRSQFNRSTLAAVHYAMQKGNPFK